MLRLLFSDKYSCLFMGRTHKDVLLADLIFNLRQITSLIEYFMGQIFNTFKAFFYAIGEQKWQEFTFRVNFFGVDLVEK